MSSLFVRVQTKLRLGSRRKVWEALEGNYASVLTGRSMDFVDLREYVPGDDVKDIDWKATARSAHPLVKRYVAERKHNVLLIADTGTAMGAHSQVDLSKRELMLHIAGALAYLAFRSGDTLGLVSGDTSGSQVLPFRGSGTHMEQALRQLDAAVANERAASDITQQIQAAARLVRRRSLVVVLGDDAPLGDATLDALRQLNVRHDVSWISVGDLNPATHGRHEIIDITSGVAIPRSLVHGLATPLNDHAMKDWLGRRDALREIGVPGVRICSLGEVVGGLLLLLEQQRAH